MTETELRGKGTEMTRRDRDDLISVCRQREKLAKAGVDARAKQMRAEFERQLAAEYSFDGSEVWKKAYLVAEAAVQQASAKISAESKALGIPAEFAPSLNLHWFQRGENACKDRQQELRRMASARIEAIAKDAKLKIEADSVEIRTRLIAGSLESPEAQAFLESMPTPESLMPADQLTIAAVRHAAKIPAGLLQ
jgi:hypothetical protein